MPRKSRHFGHTGILDLIKQFAATALQWRKCSRRFKEPTSADTWRVEINNVD